MTLRAVLQPYKGMCWDKPSLAVVACDGHDGIVLYTVGPHVLCEMEETGLRCLSELGLDDAPTGISVWEGKSIWSPGPFEHPEDGEVELRGKFRPPTKDEWECIIAGVCPWDKRLWSEALWWMEPGAACWYEARIPVRIAQQPRQIDGRMVVRLDDLPPEHPSAVVPCDTVTRRETLVGDCTPNKS